MNSRPLITASRNLFRSSYVLNRALSSPLSMARRRPMVTVTQTKVEELFDKPTASPSTPPVETRQAVSSDDYVVTDECWNRIVQLADQKKLGLDQVYLRVFVDAGGCSGFSYAFELVEDTNEPIDEAEDIVQTTNGARLAVDTTSLGFLKGSTIDYTSDMMRSAFHVRDNPNSESACGCGSSFALKNFEANPALD